MSWLKRYARALMTGRATRREAAFIDAFVGLWCAGWSIFALLSL